MKLFGVVCILLFAVAGAARADIAACPAPVGVTVVPFDQIPVALKKALHGRAGDMAMPREPFNATDVLMYGADGKMRPFNRGIFAWSRGTRWVIATERGGRAADDPVYAFDVTADGERVRLVATSRAYSGSVCTIAKGSLAAH